MRAGLELVAAVSDLKTHAPLQTRVGIATGLVVVGDLIGSGASQEQAIVGETPNLAARLQGVAEPNSVVIAESTRKLLGNLFELEDLGAQDLKGIAGPVRAWAALRPASVESRFEAFHASGLTELVGREEELELLLRRWSKAKSGEGQVVLLSGEPGIGKSRLTAALLERLANEPHTRLRYFCSPQHTDSAFYPIIGQMERAAGFAHDDTPQARLDKLDALAGADLDLQAGRGALCRHAVAAERWTLSGTRTDTATAPAKNAGRARCADRRLRTPKSGADDLRGCTLDRPNEPRSCSVGSWTGYANLRVLLIVTFRPEFEPPWIGRPHVTALTINRLAQREVDAMIDRVVGNKLLPASVRQDIIERTDGIPLFVEEMTKAVLEAESEGAARADRRSCSVSRRCSSCKPARLADGAARPARPRQGGGADRSGNWARVLSCAAGCGGAQAGGGAAIGARPSYCGRFAVSAGRATSRDLPVQACACAGRGLRHATARAATGATRPYRRNS